MKQIISIKKEKNFLKIALVEKKFNLFSIKHLELIDLKKESQEAILHKIETAKKIFNQKGVLLLSLDGSNTIEKKIEFPHIGWKKIKKLLPFQKETLFPYPMEGFIEKELFLKKEEQKEVVFLAYPKKRLDEKVQSALEESIEPKYAIFDHLGMMELVKKHFDAEEQMAVHLNENDCQVIFFQNGKIKESIVIDQGFTNICQDKENTLFQNIHRLLEVKKKEGIKKLLSGFFLKMEGVCELFENARFIDKENGLFSLEIANAIAYLKDPCLGVDLYPYQLQGYQKEIGLGLKKLRSIFLAFLILFFSFSLWVMKASSDKMTKALALDQMAPMGIQKIHLVLDEMIKNDRNFSQVLDIQKQPLSIVKMIEAITSPIIAAECELKSMSYELEKYPKFKTPLLPFLIKISLIVHGHEKHLASLQKELKIHPMVDTKKGIKVEKKQNDFYLEFFIR